MNQRTLSYVLVGSITLNAFLLGVIAMHSASRRGFMHERGERFRNDLSASESIGDQRGPRLLRGLVRAAGGPKDPRVQALWSGHHQQLKPVREEIHASRERVLGALTQEPFDRQVLSQALNDAVAARQRADQLATLGAVELADKLTPAERATLRREPRP
jgi:uncharacterized membrane protein